MKARKSSAKSSASGARASRAGKTSKPTPRTGARSRAKAAQKKLKTAAPEATSETAAPTPAPGPKTPARRRKAAAPPAQAEAPKPSRKRKPAEKPVAASAPPPAGAEPAPLKRTRARRAAAAAASAPETAPAQPAPAKPRAARKPRAPRVPKLPPILFEPDEPAPAPLSGPGEKFALGPTPPESRAELPEAELPEAYGTRRLHLTACDPHRLYAFWDLTSEQQARYNRLSADGHLVLRIFSGSAAGAPALEIHLHPESRFWFARVERANAPYTAELGYYRRAGATGRRWSRVAISPTAVTPPETISTETTMEFATIPAELTFQEIRALGGAAGREARPLARVAEELRRAGHPKFQSPTPPGLGVWTAEQQRVVEEALGPWGAFRAAPGSLEFAGPVAAGPERGLALGELAASPPGAVWSVSSPSGGEAPSARGFWLNVNAELIVYGATEPGAAVTVGGQPVALRPDGTFSCRFALPDGQYELAVVAVAPDQTEARAAVLRFSRATAQRGAVGAQPGDPNLKPPTPRDA